MILSQIAAMSRNRVIGVKGQLPWDLPEDMKFFREKTKGHIMIMGRKTFDSLPGVLPHRLHIVISRQTPEGPSKERVIYVRSMVDAIAAAKQQVGSWPEEVFVIGGGEIYKESLPMVQRIYLTILEKDFAGEACFPEFSAVEFKLTSKSIRTFEGEGPFTFSFNLYERI